MQEKFGDDILLKKTSGFRLIQRFMRSGQEQMRDVMLSVPNVVAKTFPKCVLPVVLRVSVSA